MDLCKCCLFLPEFPLALVIFFPYITDYHFFSVYTDSHLHRIPCPVQHSWFIGPFCCLGSYMSHKETWNTSNASMSDVAHGCMACTCSAGNKGCHWHWQLHLIVALQSVRVFVFWSQSQGCLCSAFFPPAWLHSTVQKAVNVIIYQTTAHRMSWAPFRFTEIFLW